ncbi:MAG: hypothetical protein D4R43_01245 [Sphingobacteriales bacterium]|nr:MAG: hypothetical protein D4R43_01245 [Sphingobacteriales bacterium]
MKIQLLFSILISSCFTFSCSNVNNFSKEEMEKAKSEIRKTDSLFCVYSIENGFAKALIVFADSEVIKLNDGENPIYGIEKLNKKLGGKEKDETVISWKPIKVEVGLSGDLGYSFGNWEYKTTTEKGDTIYYGNYFTEWKKQKDGSWKYVLDGGNNTPKPE